MRRLKYYTYKNKEYLMIGVELKNDKLFMRIKSICDNKEYLVDIDEFYIKYKRSR